MHPTNKAARIAGAMYLSMVFTAPFSLIYVPNKLIVRGDATATASNILAHETLFRLSILGDLVGQVIFICLAIALYRLLSNVNRTWALLMVGFVLVSAAVGFLEHAEQHRWSVFFFAAANFSACSTRPSATPWACCSFVCILRESLSTRSSGGYGSFPFGLLVFRSGFLPRFIGVWLMINCFGYVALSVIALFFPVLLQRRFWLPPTSLVWRIGNHALAAD